MAKVKFKDLKKGMIINLGKVIATITDLETKYRGCGVGISCHVTLADINNYKVYMFGRPNDEIITNWGAEVVYG